jgi:hypothetical protein
VLPNYSLPQSEYTSETNRIHLVLFGKQNRTSGPYLAAINRILISLMKVKGRPRTSHWSVNTVNSANN